MINDQQPKSARSVPPQFPAPFEIDTTDKSNNSKLWNAWKQQYDNYILEAGITNETRKMNTFFVAVGQETEDIYAKVAKSGDKYEDVIKALDEQFFVETIAETSASSISSNSSSSDSSSNSRSLLEYEIS